ncbi:MAG: class II aldolase/adducin family protein, partial [Calditrichia bacterium]|nr:class II aldolase/adducin family protein [Calditrichia bacterium]
EVPESIKELASETDIIMLDHHGVVAAGETLESALIKIETLEHIADSVVKASLLINGTPRILSKKEVAKLIDLRKNKFKTTGRFIDDYDFTS